MKRPLALALTTLALATASNAWAAPAADRREAVVAELRPSTLQPYAGEVFDLDLIVGLAPGRRGEIVGPPEWKDQSLIAEPWSEAERVELRHGGGGVRRRTRAVAPTAKAVELSPARQQVRVESGHERLDPFAGLGSSRREMLADLDRFFEDSPFDSFFGRGRMAEVTAESNTPTVEVRPLPQPPPAGFAGAVGQFRLQSKLVPEQAQTGEPVTWTLTLEGTGNWPAGAALPARAVPAALRTLQPKQQRHFEEGQVFSGAVSEDVVLIANQPGDHPLAPVSFVYFDPQTGRYETTMVEPPVLAITGNPIASVSSVGSEAGARRSAPHAAQSAAEASQDQPAPPDTRATAPAPHPEMDGVGIARAPLTEDAWHLLLAAPLAGLALLWLCLAARHAWLAASERRRNDARRRLRRAIEAARRCEDLEERRRALLDWQHAAIALLGLEAAPTAPRLRRVSGIDPSWIELWEQTEQALYRRDAALEPTWFERAISLSGSLAVHRRNPLRYFRRPKLVPAAAAFVLGLGLAVAGAARASDPAVADDVAPAAANDWVARYNRGLAHDRAGDEARALGETAAAFLHDPANGSVRWNLEVFASRVPGTDETLERFAQVVAGAPAAETESAISRAVTSAAGLLSPAAWQILALFGATLIALGAGLRLLEAYGVGRTPPRLWVALLTAGALTTAAGFAAVCCYDHLANPEAAMLAEATVLRSLPTDAESGQQQAALAAGSVVVMGEREFLGWTQVSAGSERGWVRTAQLVPLYGRSSS